MKKNIFLLCISVVVAFGVISCKKETTEVHDSPGAGKNCKVSEVRDEKGRLMASYQYNTLGKMSKIQVYDTIGNVMHYSLHEYTTEKLSVTNYSVGNTNEDKYDYYLGTNGNATKKITLGAYSDTTFYEYNTEGHLIKEKSRNLTNYYSYLNGNKIKVVTLIMGDTAFVQTNEYYLDKANKINNMDFEPLGKGNSNILKKQSSKDFNSQEIDTWEFTYDYHIAGYITTNRTTGSNIGYSTANYTYKCD